MKFKPSLPARMAAVVMHDFAKLLGSATAVLPRMGNIQNTLFPDTSPCSASIASIVAGFITRFWPLGSHEHSQDGVAVPSQYSSKILTDLFVLTLLGDFTLCVSIS